MAKYLQLQDENTKLREELAMARNNIKTLSLQGIYTAKNYL